MNTLQVTYLALFIIISLAISLTVSQLMLTRQRSVSEEVGMIKLSYGISFVSWVATIIILNLKSISIFGDYMQFLKRFSSNNSLTDILKTAAIYIGFTNLWLVICYFLSIALSWVFVGKRRAAYETDSNNYSYFLIIGSIFIATTICLTPLFEMTLRSFFPNLDLPFYP